MSAEPVRFDAATAAAQIHQQSLSFCRRAVNLGREGSRGLGFRGLTG